MPNSWATSGMGLPMPTSSTAWALNSGVYRFLVTGFIVAYFLLSVVQNPRAPQGTGRFTGVLWMVCANSSKSLRLAPATHKPTGTPLPSTSSERLAAVLARSVGVGPVFFPRQGGLGHRSILTPPAPVDAVAGVVLGQSRLPEAQKEAVGHPRLEAIMGRGAWAEAGGGARVPLAARSQDKEDGVGAHPVGHARASAAEAVGVRMGGPRRFHERPKLVADREAPTRAGDALGPGPPPRLFFDRFILLTHHKLPCLDRQLAELIIDSITTPLEFGAA